MPVHGCQRLGFGKAMGTGGKTMVKKTGTALEAMGRCRKLFWIFFFRWDFFRGHPPAASMEGLSCGNLEGCGEAMGRCRKLFWIFFFRWDYEPSPTGCSVVRTSKDVEKLGKACWKLSSKMEDSRNRMGYKPNIIQPFYEDTVRIQRDNQSYVWYAVVQKGLHSKLWQFYWEPGDENSPRRRVRRVRSRIPAVPLRCSIAFQGNIYRKPTRIYGKCKKNMFFL